MSKNLKWFFFVFVNDPLLITGGIILVWSFLISRKQLRFLTGEKLVVFC